MKIYHQFGLEGIQDPEIRDILYTIKNSKHIDIDKTLGRFWDTFVIDAVLGNFDRHTGNWGYLYNTQENSVTIAPIYDCGACLYPMLSDKGMESVLQSQDMINERIYEYPKATFMYNGERIRYHEFMSSKGVRDYPELAKSIVKIYAHLNMEQIKNVIRNTPEISKNLHCQPESVPVNIRQCF